MLDLSAYGTSTKMLINALAVYLKGRKHLDFNIDQMLPSEIALLKKTFRNYNEVWEDMDSECDFEIDEKSLKLGLHTFMLTFEQQRFEVLDLSD
jgi:hypothetical protein